MALCCAATVVDGFVSAALRHGTSGHGRAAGLLRPAASRATLSAARGALTPQWTASVQSDSSTPHKSASVTGTGTRVCIVGGGFGGLYTALQLARLQPLQSEEDRAKITLVDSGERFVFLPMLYELVTGELKDWEVAPVFTDLLQGTDIEFVHGTTSSIDHETRTLMVDLAAVAGGGNKQVYYDKLVVATGASAMLPSDAAAAGALPFLRVEDAQELRARLGQLRFAAARRKQQRREAGKPARPAVAIVGAGYSGVELACSLAESIGDWADVKLFHRGAQIMPGAARFNRITSYQELQRRGVAISTSVSVVKIDEGSLTLASAGGRLISASLSTS